MRFCRREHDLIFTPVFKACKPTSGAKDSCPVCTTAMALTVDLRHRRAAGGRNASVHRCSSCEAPSPN